VAETSPPPDGRVKVRLRGVRKDFLEDGNERVPVLAGIDLDVAPGEFVCLLNLHYCRQSVSGVYITQISLDIC
jgi:hypothetical protein